MTETPGLTRRDRMRAATMEEITATARRLLVEQGPDAASLRAIAREMGMTAPGLYRYFSSHEELLRYVIASMFRELAGDIRAAIEAAAPQPPSGFADESGRRTHLTMKMVAACREFRRWALNHKDEFALLFGVPVPGLDDGRFDLAEQCALEFAGTFYVLFLELWNATHFPVPAEAEIDPVLRPQLGRFGEKLRTNAPDGAILVFLRCWILLYGAVSMEVFGHLGFALDDTAPMFELTLGDLASMVGLDYPLPAASYADINIDAQFLPKADVTGMGFLLGSRGPRTGQPCAANSQGTMMTGYPSYPAYPGGPGAQLQLAEPDPAQVAVAEPARQRRVTVGFRWILVIPHLFLLCFLAIAALVVAFLGWWGALFTGRLPEFAVNYLSGFSRWFMRYQAYAYLLTDVYPPFTLDDVPGYPVRLAIPERQRLTRAAVFFRFILAIPGSVVVSVVTQGAGSIVLFVAWLITLVTGQLPRPMHQAFTALLRYQTRYYCYYWMLTPAYPWGLFGDAPAMPPAAAGYPPQYGGYGAPSPGYGTMPGYGAAPGYGAGPGYGTPASVYGAPGGYGPGQTVFQPASWQLVLSQSARRLVIVFIVLGAITYGVDAVRTGVALSNAIQRAQNTTTTNNAIDALNGSYGTLTAKMNRWESTVSACDKNLTCVTQADANAATYFSDFAGELRATTMPSGATAAANQVYSDATRVSQEYAQLSQAPNVAQYQDTFTRLRLRQSLDRFDQDFNALGTTLSNS